MIEACYFFLSKVFLLSKEGLSCTCPTRVPEYLVPIGMGYIIVVTGAGRLVTEGCISNVSPATFSTLFFLFWKIDFLSSLLGY
jgi:hypothetical protein